MGIELTTLVLFLSLFFLLLIGTPVAFALGCVSVIFTIFLWGPQGLANIPLVIMNQLSPTLLALPLFLLMAAVLERSGIADDLYEAIYRWTGFLPGGLAIGTVFICTIFAAMSGVSGAATVAMGLVAIPSMLKRNYSKHLAVGCVAAGGVLGIVIPPSVIMILYASVVKVSVGNLFFAGIVPGIIVAALHILYIGLRSARNPNYGPPLPPEEKFSLKEKVGALKRLLLPGLIVLSVLGVIYTGIATPTEAAGIGAFGAFISAALHRRLNAKLMNESLQSTLAITCMIMWVVAAASIFNSLYVAIGGRDLLINLITGLEVSPWFILIGMQLSLFFLGMIMDDYAILMLAAPIYAPIVEALGFNPIWFGVLFILNMQMAYLTPPFGFNLFYLKGVVPKGITMGDIYVSVIPFVIMQALGLALVMAFPALATWLPGFLR